MSDIRFSPSAWQKAGDAYEQGGTDLVASVVGHLSVLDVSRIGCDKGSHLIDQALSLVIPAVKDAFDAACRDLADNITGIGEAMTETGVAYEQVEQANVELARLIGEVL